MSSQPIAAIVSRQLPVTLLLAFYAVVLSVIVSVPLGILAALRQNGWQDYLVRFITIPGQALPSFWIALLILLGLTFFFQWSPPIIYTNPWEDPWNHLKIMVWPVLLLTWEHSSHIARATRAYILDVMYEDYILTARAKGLSQTRIVLRHALRNALVPTITILGLQLGGLLGGALFLESIFGLPGIGRGLVRAALVRDYPVIQTLVTLLVFTMLTLNFIIDIIYRIIDPRISYSKSTLSRTMDHSGSGNEGITNE